jgi:HEAT repeat protein
MMNMSGLNREFGYCKSSESTRETPLSEELKGLIRDLSLKEREFELIHPKKSKAIEKLMQRGEAAVEPLIEAFDDADAESRGWIIYILGALTDRGALLPISWYLNADEEKIRTIEADALRNFDSREIKRLIKAAKQIEARADSDHSPTGDAHIRDGIEEPFII